MQANNKLPKDLIDHWPEIFNDIEIEAIPLEYLTSVNVTFTDGNTWIIDIDPQQQMTAEDLEDTLGELFTEYEDTIANVDFRLDTKKVKKDIQSRTRQFLKKPK